MTPVAARAPDPVAAPLDAATIALADARHVPLWNMWSALAAAAPPFASPAFFTLDRELVSGGEALLAGAWRGARLVGALPLLHDHDRLRALRSAHSPGYDYCGAPEGLDAIWRALAADERWTTLVFEHVRPDALVATRLVELARRSGCQVATRPGARHPWFALPGFEAQLGPKFLTNLRRCERKAGGLVYERLAAPTRADFAEALALESSGWKTAAGSSLGGDAHAAHLYRVLLKLFGPRGQAALHFVRAGGTRIAMLLSVEDERTLYALKIGHDPAASALGPGHLVVWKAAREAEQRGLVELNFVGRDDEWKRKWTAEAHEHVSITIYRPSLRGLYAFATHEIAAPRLQKLGIDAHHPLPRHCQKDDIIGVHTLTERLRGRLRQGLGVKTGLKRALGLVPAPAQGQGAPSQFAAGSWVRVRDAAAVRATLDARAKLRGLVFVPSQFQACGGVYRVARAVRRIRDDAGRFRPVARTVLLDGVTCAGHGPEPAGCGRHCPLMFRDEWLEPAADPHRPPPTALHRRHARVRSRWEIEAGLDARGRRDGITFMPEMAALADHRLAIAATLTRVYEYDRWVETPRPVYILDGANCSGAIVGRRGPCDRACALLWHEDWLILDPVPSC